MVSDLGVLLSSNGCRWAVQGRSPIPSLLTPAPIWGCWLFSALRFEQHWLLKIIYVIDKKLLSFNQPEPEPCSTEGKTLVGWLHCLFLFFWGVSCFVVWIISGSGLLDHLDWTVRRPSEVVVQEHQHTSWEAAFCPLLPLLSSNSKSGPNFSAQCCFQCWKWNISAAQVCVCNCWCVLGRWWSLVTLRRKGSTEMESLGSYFFQCPQMGIASFRITTHVPWVLQWELWYGMELFKSFCATSLSLYSVCISC